MGKIYIPTIAHGIFYCPVCVPRENEYTYKVHGIRLCVNGWPGDIHQLYIQKSHGNPRWLPKEIVKFINVSQWSYIQMIPQLS